MLARRVQLMEDMARQTGGLAVQCDVSVDGAVEDAVSKVLASLGRIDVAIANAGIAVSGTVARLDISEYRRQMETNVFGVLRTVKATLAPLRETRGRLAIVGSVNGHLAVPGWSAYVMSKFAVRGLAEVLAFEVAPDGVSVTHVAPGFVESEMRLRDRTGNVREGAKDPVPRWLVMSGKAAAAEIADAIEARRPEAVITGHGKVAAALSRYAPGLVRAAVGFASSRMKEPTWG